MIGGCGCGFRREWVRNRKKVGDSGLYIASRERNNPRSMNEQWECDQRKSYNSSISYMSSTKAYAALHDEGMLRTR